MTHYLIHLYDYPATAQKGLDAANRYAKIAPAAPHAQHMPSHIYTRVGYWKESIASNAASVKAAKAEKSVGNYLHAQDYMVYAHLQLAQDQQARAVIDDMLKETDFKATVAAADYALAASPARYAIERGDWDAASQLAVRPSGLNFAMSISHYARGRRGALRQPEAAKANQKARNARQATQAKDNYCRRSSLQRKVERTGCACGVNTRGARPWVQSDAEDKPEKHVITPGSDGAGPRTTLDAARRGNPLRRLRRSRPPRSRTEPLPGYAGAAQPRKNGDKARAKDNTRNSRDGGEEDDRPEVRAARQYLRRTELRAGGGAMRTTPYWQPSA